jgi:hypothetical protein
LAGYEFKIVRSLGGAFGKPDRLRAVLDEEARAGWELVEVFDAGRIRLKRPVECRKNDAACGIDPYRTRVGMGEYALAAVMICVALLLGAAAILFALSCGRSEAERDASRAARWRADQEFRRYQDQERARRGAAWFGNNAPVPQPKD